MKDFKNRVALITGAAHGFGAELAQEAARRGMKLVLADIDEPALKRSVQQVADLGAQVESIVADVSLEEDVDKMVKAAMARFGQIDLLINDAGIALAGTVWQLPSRDWEWIMHVNLMSQVYAMQRVIPIMLKQKTPCHIVNVASIAGLIDTPGMPAYHASKFASVGLTEATAYDLQRAGANINLSVMCPGFVQTDLYHTEDRRPERYQAPDDPYYQSPTFKAGQQMAKYVIETGMPIDSIALTVFQAIEDDEFYILTHPVFNTLIGDRVKRIVNGDKPDVSVMDGLM